MKKIALVIVLLCIATRVALAWGNYSHMKINRLAIFLLPDKIKKFFENSMDVIADHAIDLDKRQASETTEASKHIFAADHYGSNPFIVLPEKYNDAVKKYSEDTLKKYGTLPWVILDLQEKLTKAFAAKDTSQILHFSTELGHYMADAHAPLHCCQNYDGKLSGQIGIQKLWESTLPELFSDKYNFHLHSAKLISDPGKTVWKIIQDSYKMSDSVLNIESQLLQSFPDDVKYVIVDKQGVKTKVLSDDFAQGYHIKLRGMVERRIRSSIQDIANFWFTAWSNAGKPDLTQFISPQPVYFKNRVQLYEKMTSPVMEE